MSHRLTATITAIALGALLGSAHAQQPDKNKPGKDKAAAAGATVAGGFSASERQIIVEYFGQHRTAVKPLPPGIAKNLARGKPLPPGIAKQRIPGDLVRRLPPRQGVEITIFGDRIVLLEAGGLVVDILADVFK